MALGKEIFGDEGGVIELIMGYGEFLQHFVDATIMTECKWANKPVTTKDLENFLNKISAVSSKKKKVGIIIGKGGFSVYSSGKVCLSI